jgi:alkylated DNA nucleotide flippase Atl1
LNGQARHIFTVNGPNATPATPTTLAAAGLKERADLQEWVIKHPEVLGDDILIVTCEYDQWESNTGSTAKERLDVLGLDTAGRLVVVELKRDADARIHQQAITYAAMVSGFDEDALAHVHANFLTLRGTPTTAAAALDRLREHVGGELDQETLSVPRIVLLAASHPPQVVTTVVWLTKFGIDIELRRVQAYTTGGQVHVAFDQVYPVPGVDSLLLAPARKQAAVAVQKAQERERAANAVRTIIEEGLIEDGSPLTLTTTTEVLPDIRAAVLAWVEADPTRGQAEWVNDKKNPLRWAHDGQVWQPTTLIRHILKEAADLDRTVRGTAWWVTEDGLNLAEVAGIASGTQGRDWTDLHDLIRLIGPGEWASYGDLGEVLELPARPIGTHIGKCGSCPDGAWRVLTYEGQPSDSFHWSDPTDARSVKEVLQSEGLTFDGAGRADPARRLSSSVLAQRLTAQNVS